MVRNLLSKWRHQRCHSLGHPMDEQIVMVSVAPDVMQSDGTILRGDTWDQRACRCTLNHGLLGRWFR